MTNRCQVLDENFSKASTLRDLPVNIMSVVADQVQDTLNLKTSDDMQVFNEQLQELVRDALQKLHPTVLQSIHYPAYGDPRILDAYILGQLNFASMLVTAATLKRASVKFYELAEDPAYRKYLDQLVSRELSSRELAEAFGEDQIAAEDKLGLLREQGLVELRKNGAITVYVLTLAARSVTAT